MNNIGARLRNLRETMGLTQKDFSKRFYMRQQSLSKYETNKLAIPDSLKIELSHAGININWLITGEGSQYISNFNKDNLIQAQVLQAEVDILAGNPVRMKTPPYRVLAVAKPIMKIKEDYHCYRVNGRDMEPQYLNNDLILIKKDNDWIDKINKGCAVRINGKVHFMKVTYDTDSEMVFLSTNKVDDKPIIFDPKKSDIELIGHICYMSRSWSKEE
jgi:phage repressor protein C with HTH and peptisase S24 domain